MKRGNIVILQAANSPASKARPCLIVQRDSTIAGSVKVTVCPLTSEIRGIDSVRPSVAASEVTGLKRASEVEADWVTTFPVSKIDRVIGCVDDDTMRRVDRALRRWLDL